MVDYEKTAINDIKELFRDTQVNGCFFIWLNACDGMFKHVVCKRRTAKIKNLRCK